MSFANQLRDLSHRKDRLQTEIDDLGKSHKMQRLEAEISSLHHRLESEFQYFQDTLNENSEHNSKLSHLVSKHLKASTNLLQHIESLDTALSSLQQNTNQLTNKNQYLQDTVNKKTKDLSRLTLQHQRNQIDNTQMKKELATRRDKDADHTAAMYFVSEYVTSIIEEDYDMFKPTVDALKLMTPGMFPAEEIGPVAKALQMGRIPRGRGVWTKDEDDMLERAIRNLTSVPKSIVRKHGNEKTLLRTQWILHQKDEISWDYSAWRILVPERFCKTHGCDKFFLTDCRVAKHRHNADHHSEFKGCRRSKRRIERLSRHGMGGVQVVVYV